MHQNWKVLEEYGLKKIHTKTLFKLLLGIMAGFFVGLGYTGLIILYTPDPSIQLFLGSIIFCTGILMCMYVGGNLFTTNCAGLAPIITKKTKWHQFLYDLVITLIGNYIGSMVVAGFIYTIKDKSHYQSFISNLITIGEAKINSEWYETFFSAIITNILVMASLFCFLWFENKVIGFVMTLFMITLFALTGYQHVVANMFITTIYLFEGGGSSDMANTMLRVFCHNLIPSLIGNLAGGLLMVYIYYLCLNKAHKKH